jgi:hypothetical protein
MITKPLIVILVYTTVSTGFPGVETLRRNDLQRRAMLAGWNSYLRRLKSTPPVPGKSLPRVGGH